MSALLGSGLSAEELNQLSPLQRLWFLRRHYLKQDDAEAAARVGKRMATARVDMGLRNASTVATALIAEARDADDPEQAAAAATLATELAPTLPATHLAAARIQRRAGAPGSFATLSTGLRTIADHPGTRMRLLGTLALVLLFATGAGATLFAAFVTLRHAPSFVHDLSHALNEKAKGILLVTVAVALLTMPLILGFGPAVWIMWLLIVTWLYLRRTERIVAAVVIVFLASLPWTLPRATGFIAFVAGDPGVLAAARDEEPSRESRRVLRAMVDRQHPDPHAMQLLGLIHKRAGEYEEALALLEPLAEQQPRDWTNVGIVQYGLGRPEAAVESLRKAANAAPDSFAAQYNLMQVLFERARHEEGKKAQAAASAIDPDRTSRLRARIQGFPDDAKTVAGTPDRISAAFLNRAFVEEAVSDDVLIARAFDSEGAAGSLAENLWKSYVGGIPLRTVPIFAGGVLLLWAVLTVVSRRARTATPCRRCADPVCVVCDGPPRTDQLCPRCVAAFVDSSGTDPAKRRQQESKVDRRERTGRLVRGLLGFILPGSGHVLAGRPARGTLLAVCALLFAAMIVAGNRLLPLETPVRSLSTWLLVISATGLVVTMVIGLLGARRT